MDCVHDAGVLAELDLTPARSGMDGSAAEPWVSVAAAGSMVLIEGRVAEVRDDMLSRGDWHHGL